MNREKKLELLKNLHWDVNRHGDFYNKIIDGGINTFPEYERMSLLIRLFERLDWQQLVEIMGIDTIKEYLTVDLIKRIRFVYLRNKYDRIRRVLYGGTLPISGWSDDYRKTIKSTLLSDRWYSSKPALL